MSTPFKGSIHRGAGVIARWPGICIVTPDKNNNKEALNRLYAHLGSSPSADTLETVIQPLLEEIGVLGAIIQTSTGGIALTYGEMLILTDDKALVTGEKGKQKKENLPFKASRIVICLQEEKMSKPVAPYDLQEGISPGAGLSLIRKDTDATRNVEIPVENQEDEQAEETTSSTAQETAPTTEPEVQQIPLVRRAITTPYILLNTFPAPRTTPLPTNNTVKDAARHVHDKRVKVAGVLCSRGHFNEESASFCRVCGLPLEESEKTLIEQYRPTLGFIIFDDGATYGLDRSYSIGRNPTVPDNPAVEILKIYEDNETLSRNHAEIVLQDWAVAIVDKGSTNGSFIWNTEEESWTRLEEDEPEIIESGTTIALGRRAFVYESVETSK